MVKKITIGGREYILPKIDFNAVCELEDLGFDFSKVDKKMMSTGRALLAFVMKTDIKTASAAFEREMEINKNAFNDIFVPLFNMISESDFFRKMAQQDVETETRPS